MSVRMISMFQRISPIGLSVVLFIPLIFFGVLNYSDYGLAWDEPAQHEIGTMSYNYLVHGDEALLDYRDKDYGVAFELPLIFLEKLLGFEDTRPIYHMRHLVAHMFFLFCLFCGYWLVYRLFKNQWLAAAGVLLFALHPVLYAHSFFNTKDIPFMGMYLVCFLLIQRTFEKYSYTYFALAGAAIGVLVNLRIMGILLLVFVLFFSVVDLIKTKSNGAERLHIVQGLILFLLGFWVALYFAWPYLYADTFQKFASAFSGMSKFRWYREVLYFGELIKATDVPWHYALVWFAISTPLVYLISGLFGLALAIHYFISRPYRIFDNGLDRNLVLYLICFTAPFVAVVAFGSVLYDGWRHLYFTYPPFVLLVLYGIHRVSNARLQKAAGWVLTAAFVGSLVFMVRNHPHQQVYFNLLVNRSETEHERKCFELDYWGVSYRQGIAHILEVDDSPQIDVQMWSASGEYNLMLLKPEDRERIHLTHDDPKYFITEYRWHPEDFLYNDSQEIFNVRVQNSTVLSVFKLRD